MGKLKTKFRANIYQDFVIEGDSLEFLENEARKIARAFFLEACNASGYEVHSLDEKMLGFNFDA